MLNFTDNFYQKSFKKFKGYKTYHTIHSYTIKGECAVVIKENIYHSEDVKFEAEGIRTMAVNIKTKSNDIKVVSSYNFLKYKIKSERYVEFFKFVGN